jgi:hypothetical protein
MSTMPPAAPAAPGAPQKKSNTLLFVLAGCGGCLVIAAVVLVVGGLYARKKVSNGMTGLMLVAQEVQLQSMLSNDTDHTRRIEAAYKTLDDKAAKQQLTVSDITPLQNEVQKVTKDGVITSDEAEEVTAMAEDLAGS